MLPSASEFDAYLTPAEGASVRAQLMRAEAITGQLDELVQRAQRARALAYLACSDAGMTYADIGHVSGRSRARVAQLIADGRLWRESESGAPAAV